MNRRHFIAKIDGRTWGVPSVWSINAKVVQALPDDAFSKAVMSENMLKRLKFAQ